GEAPHARRACPLDPSRPPRHAPRDPCHVLEGSPAPPHLSLTLLSAERGGFEPPMPQGHTRFRVVPFQPGSRTSPNAICLAHGSLAVDARDARASRRRDGEERLPPRP